MTYPWGSAEICDVDDVDDDVDEEDMVQYRRGSIGVAVEEYHVITIYIFTLYTNCQSDFFPRAFLSASLNKMFIVFTMFQHCIDHRYQVSFRKSGGGGRWGGGRRETCCLAKLFSLSVLPCLAQSRH